VTDPNRDHLIATARALGDLVDEIVFLGGSIVGLLITDPGSAPVRPTKDVDGIVDPPSRLRYQQLTNRLETKGFRPDPDGPICRYIKDDLMVDMMLVNSEILSFSNRWYATAMQHHHTIVLEAGASIRVIDAPVFIGTKLEAFHIRGATDPMMSHDLEDILMIVDGRSELIAEIANTVPELREYLTEQFAALQSSAFFDDVLSGTFDAARGQIVRGRWDAIANQTNLEEPHV
jgi:hypothetical protein